MASVRIVYTFPDSAHLEVTVKAETSYPDALDQARVQAVKAFRDAVLERETATDV